MDRPRQVRIVYRDSYTSSLWRFVTSKAVVISVVLIATGLGLFVVSLHYDNVIQSKFIQGSSMTVTNSGSSDFYFSEPAEITSNATFTIPSHSSVNYRLYRVDNYTQNFIAKTSLSLVAQGTAVNNTVVSIGQVYTPQGQEYMFAVNTSGQVPVNAHISVTAMILLTEHSDRYLGGPGIMLGMAGSLIFAASVPSIYRRMKYLS